MKQREPSPHWLRRMLHALEFIEGANGRGWANDGTLHRSLLARGLVEEIDSFMHCRVTDAGRKFMTENRNAR